MIPGIYSQIKSKQEARDRRAAAALHAADGPRVCHDHEVAADVLGGQIATLKSHAEENERMIGNLQGLLMELAASGHQSAHRTLALRHLEDAQSRLMRELGERPV